MKAEEMKSVKQWLETIADEEIREKALSNMDDDGTTEVGTLNGAISEAFIWENTEQGQDYWYEIARLAFYDELETITP